MPSANSDTTLFEWGGQTTPKSQMAFTTDIEEGNWEQGNYDAASW